MSSSIQIIANGKAKGMLDADARASFLALVEKVIPGARVDFFGEGKSVEELVTAGRKRGAAVIAAAGGDGTMNAVASVLLQTDPTREGGAGVVLGVLPMGTLNHFAKDLGIPVATEAALAVLTSGAPIRIDVGAVGDRIFLNNSGLGLYPDMVFNRERRQEHGASKWGAVMVESLRALRRYRRLHLHITIDGETITRRTPVVFVGNNEYSMTGTLASERDSLRDGQLCLYIPHPQRRMGLLWFSLRALFGDPAGDRNFDKILTHEFSISTKRRELRVSIDGEVTRLPTPLQYSIRPQSLSVMVPAEVAQNVSPVA